MARLEIKEHGGVATVSEDAPGRAVGRKSMLLEMLCTSLARDLVCAVNDDMGCALVVRHADSARQGSKDVRRQTAAGTHAFAAHNA